MKKQLFTAGAALLVVVLLFALGRTAEKKSTNPKAAIAANAFNINTFVDSATGALSPEHAAYISSLKSDSAGTDINTRIAAFWRDSIRLFEPFAYYTSQAAKLDNSEKSLTFAARLFLERLRHEQDEARLEWQTSEAIELYEKAIALDTANNDLRVELGSVYVYGRGRTGNPEATMKGIQELLAVTKKDTGNMKAQLVLGVGGMISGQYDKAIERFKLIVSREPANLEAIAYLADAYAAKGDKGEATKWYNIAKKVANNPAFTKEVDERIKQLR